MSKMSYIGFRLSNDLKKKIHLTKFGLIKSFKKVDLKLTSYIQKVPPF